MVSMPVGEVIGSEGEGRLLGWYIGLDDGLPRRLPVHSYARERYVGWRGVRKQKMVFIEPAGTFDSSGTVIPVPGKSNMVRTVPLPDKYAHLDELCEERNPDGSYRLPELRDARLRLYSGIRSAVPQTFPCACGLKFGSQPIHALHVQICPSAATGASAPSPSSRAVAADSPAPGAPVAKTRKPVSCRACGELFDTLPEHNRHKRAAHPRERK